MAWLIFFVFWIVFLWLYKYSERHKQRRIMDMQKDKHSDYGQMKNEFDESMGLFNTTADFKARLAHIDKAIECLKGMEEMIPDKEHSSEKLAQIMSLKQALIYSGIKAQFENAMNSAKEAKLLVAKVKHANTAQAILNEGLSLGIDRKTLAREIEEANSFINRIQYDEYFAKAKKEEERGNIKMAIDQYQVALYFLKMTSMGGEDHSSLVKEIEGRIQKLYEGGIAQGEYRR